MRKLLPLLIAVGAVPAAVIGVQTINSSMHPTAAAHARVAPVAAVTAPARTAPATVKVVMRDPGCHWFAVGAHFKTKLAVTGTAKLSNLDEATLKIKRAGSLRWILIRFGQGRSRICSTGGRCSRLMFQKSAKARARSQTPGPVIRQCVSRHSVAKAEPML